ncbi:hypothetical protein PoB_007147500 [Plakobranchus ocellatus]|uniref:Uncharacterized protein n=1 Tax=Plakobranchus ocellatus TaxID=259542 RepID=A0AAV4DLN0_9GAST|nr:hypothetical protein PoB_007147500 [Plakobranchus ocellatus]
MGVGGTMDSESALRCARTPLSRVRALPPAPRPDGGGPESLRSSCCGRAISTNQTNLLRRAECTLTRTQTRDHSYSDCQRYRHQGFPAGGEEMSMREKRNVTFQEPEIRRAFQDEPNNNKEAKSKPGIPVSHISSNGGSVGFTGDKNPAANGSSSCLSSSNKKAADENPRSNRSRSRARSRSWSRFRARRAKSQDAGSVATSMISGRDTSAGGLKRDRSLVSLVRTGSRNSVRSLVKLFETRTISTVS